MDHLRLFRPDLLKAFDFPKNEDHFHSESFTCFNLPRINYFKALIVKVLKQIFMEQFDSN